MAKWRSFGWCLCLALASSGVLWGQRSDAGNEERTPYDLRGECLSDLQGVQEKFLALANAVPAEKLNWRPSSNSRSFAEVFLHVAAERYVILGLMGAAVPSQFEPMMVQKSTSDFEQSTPKDRARVVDELTKSWEFTQRTLESISNTDFSKPLAKPSRQKTEGNLVFLLLADQHEHLGQAVAYARENGIVPPWSGAPTNSTSPGKPEQK
jgi:uncharacterized damage-inducible protein DinB